LTSALSTHSESTDPPNPCSPRIRLQIGRGRGALAFTLTEPLLVRLGLWPAFATMAAQRSAASRRAGTCISARGAERLAANKTGPEGESGDLRLESQGSGGPAQGANKRAWSAAVVVSRAETSSSDRSKIAGASSLRASWFQTRLCSQTTGR
jgi:hypothetical protein